MSCDIVPTIFTDPWNTVGPFCVTAPVVTTDIGFIVVAPSEHAFTMFAKLLFPIDAVNVVPEAYTYGDVVIVAT